MNCINNMITKRMKNIEEKQMNKEAKKMNLKKIKRMK